MTIPTEAPEQFEYSCERCKTRFVLPPSSRKLSLRGSLRAVVMGAGRAVKMHEGPGAGFDAVRREILAKKNDDAYQAFVQSFRFCHECRQFVCSDCWSKARGTCLTCAARATTSSARTGPVVTAAAAAPEIPRPTIQAAPRRRGRSGRYFGLVATMLAIVLLSIEGGVLLLNATGGPSDLSGGQTQGPASATDSSAPGLSGGTPEPNPSGGVTPGSSIDPSATGGPTDTLAPGATPGPGATRRPGRTPRPPTPSPAPGEVIVTASSYVVTYGDAAPSVTVESYNPPIAPAVTATCTTTYAAGHGVSSSDTTSCSGASTPGYYFTYFTGTVTVDPAQITVTATSRSITYGDPQPAITVLSYSPSVSPATPATCSTPYAQGADAGIYPTTCSNAADPNYTFSYVGGSVSVARLSIQVTCQASPNPITAGDPVPTYSFSQTGSFYTGDGWASDPTCTSTYAPTDVGAQTPSVTFASFGALTAPSNYTVTHSDGMLTVNP